MLAWLLSSVRPALPDVSILPVGFFLLRLLPALAQNKALK
jgi:hypothetical protein